MSDSIRSYADRLRALADEVAVTDRDGSRLSFQDGLQRFMTQMSRVAGERKKVLYLGNGGSAAIASHMAADWTKNLNLPTLSFADGALLTCVSNDLGYENVYSIPTNVFAVEGDLCVSISSSGESENIIRAAMAAVEAGCTVVTLSGFSETNRLRSIGDLNFYVPSPEYGSVEILHMTICQYCTDRYMERMAARGS